MLLPETIAIIVDCIALFNWTLVCGVLDLEIIPYGFLNENLREIIIR